MSKKAYPNAVRTAKRPGPSEQKRPEPPEWCEHPRRGVHLGNRKAESVGNAPCKGHIHTCEWCGVRRNAEWTVDLISVALWERHPWLTTVKDEGGAVEPEGDHAHEKPKRLESIKREISRMAPRRKPTVRLIPATLPHDGIRYERAVHKLEGGWAVIVSTEPLADSVLIAEDRVWIKRCLDLGYLTREKPQDEDIKRWRPNHGSANWHRKQPQAPPTYKVMKMARKAQKELRVALDHWGVSWSEWKGSTIFQRPGHLQFGPQAAAFENEAGLQGFAQPEDLQQDPYAAPIPLLLLRDEVRKSLIKAVHPYFLERRYGIEFKTEQVVDKLLVQLLRLRIVQRLIERALYTKMVQAGALDAEIGEFLRKPNKRAEGRSLLLCGIDTPMVELRYNGTFVEPETEDPIDAQAGKVRLEELVKPGSVFVVLLGGDHDVEHRAEESQSE